ncbi:tetratricopeptide repeat protein [Phormidesmis priestleyi]
MTVNFSDFSTWVSAMMAVASLNLGVLSAQSADAPQTQPSPTVQPSPKPPAKPPQKDEFPPSPLELTVPDPLLPNGLKTPLSAADRSRLTIALNTLNQQAFDKLAAGEPLEAFDLWNRELRLRRALGFLEEVKALGRVGDLAWKQNQPNQVRVITNRLQAIQTQVETGKLDKIPPQPAFDRTQLLSALGTAYQQVRSPGLAVSVYENLLAEARQRKDVTQEVSLLNTIGQLHLSWFDYPKAIATYTDLLNGSKARGDRSNEIASISQLAYAHEQAKQPGQAVPYQQQLVQLYQQTQQQPLVPALKIRIADNYAASGQVALAEQTYQEAFTLAQPLLQSAYAADALRKLGALYRKNDRPDAALRVYEYLIGLGQQASDLYSTMDAYDQIGQIHLGRKSYPEAVNAFNQALKLAKQLDYRMDYFTNQIQLAQKGE